MQVVLGGLLIPLVVTFLSMISWTRRREAGKRALWWPWAVLAVGLGVAALAAIDSAHPIAHRNWGDLAIKVVPLVLWSAAMVPVGRVCKRRWTFVAASVVLAAASYFTVGLVEQSLGVPPAHAQSRDAVAHPAW